MSKRTELQEEINKLQKELGALPLTKTEILEQRITLLEGRNKILEAHIDTLLSKETPHIWPPIPYRDPYPYQPIITWREGTGDTNYTIKEFSSDTITLYET